MKGKIKFVLWALGPILLLGYINVASADYWTRHTRSSSSTALPQYFELENMAKSSLGVRFFYGTDRKEMAGAGTDDHNLISYDGTTWTEQTSAVESAAGYSDIEFQTMYADSNGNIWMPNRRDSNRPLIKYNGSSGNFEKISASTIAGQAFPGGNPAQLKVNNLFTGPSGNIYAVASSDSQLYIIYYDGSWHDTGITAGPLDAYGADGDIYGVYSSLGGGNSFWLYKFHSSENEYSNPSGGDQGAGIWHYDDSTGWVHYSSSTTTSDGATFVNGITEAFADSTGKVWVGSRHGVFMHNGTDWVNWTKDNNNLFTNRVIKIQEDSGGRVWIIALENENTTDDKGGISIYTPSDGSWDYYTSHNGESAIDNATNIFMIGTGSEAWMFTGHGEQAMSAGIYQLTRDNAHTALYGQVSGTTITKAGFETLKKKTSSKKVTIWKKYKVKKKWKKKKIYSGKSSSGWYKRLNLAAGTNIKYIIKVGKKSRTVSANTGDPIRVNLK